MRAEIFSEKEFFQNKKIEEIKKTIEETILKIEKISELQLHYNFSDYLKLKEEIQEHLKNRNFPSDEIEINPEKMHYRDDPLVVLTKEKEVLEAKWPTRQLPPELRNSFGKAVDQLPHLQTVLRHQKKELEDIEKELKTFTENDSTEENSLTKENEKLREEIEFLKGKIKEGEEKNKIRKLSPN